jgi:hypothetical protein
MCGVSTFYYSCVRCTLFLLATFLCLPGCSSKTPAPDGLESGYVSGKVADWMGNPIRGAKILIDHDIFFNATIQTESDVNGSYRVKVPAGSWYAFAIHQAAMAGESYRFYLSPDNSSGFGGEGAVRNFTWRLSGVMPEPLSGYFGGLITLDSYPGVYVDLTDTEFILTPNGKLVDNSIGKELRVRTSDGYLINDIPVGPYTLRASHQGRPVRFRRWNSEEAFSESYDLKFFAQISGQCDRCAKLEYIW